MGECVKDGVASDEGCDMALVSGWRMEYFRVSQLQGRGEARLDIEGWVE